MNSTEQVGYLPLAFTALVILVVMIVLKRRRERRVQLLLVAAVALLGAVTLRIALLMSDAVLDEANRLALRRVVLAFNALAGVLIIGQFFVKERGERLNVRWKSLALTVMPIWISGIYGVYVNHFVISSAVLILSFLIAWFDWQLQADERAEAREKELERRQALLFQEMMNPHFIFNSLQVIGQQCRADPFLGADSLDALAGYIRKNLDAVTAGAMIAFEKELEHIEEYVALERLVPGSAFDVVYDLAVRDFQVPALSIQPLVENAIHYGARPMGEEGVVFLTTQRQGRVVRVTIEDNGRGFPGTTTQQREHISHGLESVRGRLTAQCGGSLSIHSDEKGTRVVVLIPEGRKDDHIDRG